MAKKQGKEFKLYISTTLLTGATSTDVDARMTAGDFNEVAAVTNVNNNSEKNEIELQTRENGGQTVYFDGAFQEGIEVSLAYDTSDTRYTELQDAYINGTEIAVADVDGVLGAVGVKGWAGNCKVLAFNRPEGIDDAVVIDVRLRPSSHIVRKYESTAA